MPTKVLELEISETIEPIWIDSGYDSVAILVRSHRQPLGWIRITLADPSPLMISVEQLQQEIKLQLGSELIRQAMMHNLSLAKINSTVLEPISVVVCTRDRPAQLESCLKAILDLDYPDYEIIVVDNSPSTNTTANLVTQFPVRYVREDKLGIAWARNRGVAEAQYNIVAFTDDDARVDRFWLREIAASFTNEQVMAVTGFVAPAELETAAQLLFEFDYGGMSHGFHQRVIRRDLLTTVELLWSCSFGVTANAAFRKQIFNEVGLFDVALAPSIGGEDIELFHRIVAQGHTLVYSPAALVWHIHRRHMSALYQQIFNNCRSFGCYLLTCFRNRSVARSTILRFFLYEWLCKWILIRLIRPYPLPRYVVLTELAGMLSSPLAYRSILTAIETTTQSAKTTMETHQPGNALL